MYKSILIAGALLSITTPALAQQKFDAIDLLSHVRELSSDAYAGREAGSAGNEKARAYVEAAFERAGLAHFGDDYVEPFEFTSRRDNQSYPGANVIGYVRGSESTDRYLVVSAHFDHLGERNGEIYNGADDNASGTAGLLLAAAYFSAHPPKHSIIFVAFDAEEKGLQGARAFVAKPPVERSEIALNINMDMISHNDRDELYAVGTHHYPFLKPYLEKVAASSDIKLLFGHDLPGTGSDDWTGASDHGPFHSEWELPFVYFGVEDHVDYHKPTDDYENIEPAFFIQAVDTILDAIVELDANLDSIAEW
jgi:Zn-dependent M28 family amino/carboxypeptidase